jgi:hypothetical protein
MRRWLLHLYFSQKDIESGRRCRAITTLYRAYHKETWARQRRRCF